MVEQRPFKALVVGSSPTQPMFFFASFVALGSSCISRLASDQCRSRKAISSRLRLPFVALFLGLFGRVGLFDLCLGYLFCDSALIRSSVGKPSIVFRFRQSLALLQPGLNIFLDDLDELGIRRYPILVVAHTSHKERWTVTNERLILVGPRDEQGIMVTRLSVHFRSLWQHSFLHSSWRPHRLHLKEKRVLPT